MGHLFTCFLESRSVLTGILWLAVMTPLVNILGEGEQLSICFSPPRRRRDGSQTLGSFLVQPKRKAFSTPTSSGMVFCKIKNDPHVARKPKTQENRKKIHKEKHGDTKKYKGEFIELLRKFICFKNTEIYFTERL